jgi:hypothetical protein
MTSQQTNIEDSTSGKDNLSKDELVDMAIESLTKINQQLLEEQEKQG